MERQKLYRVISRRCSNLGSLELRILINFVAHKNSCELSEEGVARLDDRLLIPLDIYAQQTGWFFLAIFLKDFASCLGKR